MLITLHLLAVMTISIMSKCHINASKEDRRLKLNINPNLTLSPVFSVTPNVRILKRLLILRMLLYLLYRWNSSISNPIDSTFSGCSLLLSSSC